MGSGLAVLFRKLWNNKIVLVSFYVSILLPAYCLSSARCYYEQLDKLYPDTLKEGTTFIFQGEALNPSEQESVKRLSGKSIAYNFRVDEVVPDISVNLEITVKGIGGDTEVFTKTLMSKGRFFDADELARDKKVCIISKNIAVSNHLKVGDHVKFRGVLFEIIGWSKEYDRNVIMVPYSQFPQVYGSSKIQQEILVAESMESSGVKKVNEFLKSVVGEDNSIVIEDWKNSQQGAVELVKKLVFSRVAVGVAVSVFAFFNVFMVLLGQVKQKKEQYAIRRALGADGKALFKVFLKDNSIHMGGAVLLLLFTFEPIIRLMRLNDEVVFDAVSVSGIVVFAVLFCVLLSILLTRRLMQETIYALLQEEVV